MKKPANKSELCSLNTTHFKGASSEQMDEFDPK